MQVNVPALKYQQKKTKFIQSRKISMPENIYLKFMLNAKQKLPTLN